jgi:hypothetical protein
MGPVRTRIRLPNTSGWEERKDPSGAKALTDFTRVTRLWRAVPPRRSVSGRGTHTAKRVVLTFFPSLAVSFRLRSV